METIISARDLLKAGAHFGHRTSRWNPKMKKYIFTKRNHVHIIDLRQTIRGFIDAYHFLRRISADGRRVLFVGTKRQARDTILNEAKRCGAFHVTERWLGGTLTNLETIRSQIERLKSLEKTEKDGSIEKFNKKELSRFRREKRRITRNLDGIRDMNRLPGALVIVDPVREHIAVEEANKLGVPVIAVIDTDGDPDPIDIPIPANDDAIQGIKLLVARLADGVLEGRGGVAATAAPATPEVVVPKNAQAWSSEVLEGKQERRGPEETGGPEGLPRSASPTDAAPAVEKDKGERRGPRSRRPPARGARPHDREGRREAAPPAPGAPGREGGAQAAPPQGGASQ